MKFTMLRYLLLSFCLVFSAVNTAYAEDEVVEEAAGPKYAYYDFDSDIVTNFVSPGNKLGYLRVSISLMVADGADLDVVKHQEPLIRDAIIEIVGRQSEATVTSLAGREDIRQACLKQIHKLMISETNRKVVINLLFTKYLYN